MAVANNGLQSSYVWLPQGSHPGVSHTERGKSTFLFNCSKSAVVTFKVEGSAPNSESDSFYIAVDGDDVEEWHYPRTSESHWKTFPSEYSISEGLHEFHVLGREDGTKLRRVGLVKGRGTCCFTIPGIFQLYDTFYLF